MKRQCYFFLFFFSTILLGNGQELDSLILELESNMAKRTYYDSQKEASIQRLLEQVNENTDPVAAYNIYDEVIEEYRYYSFDKALEYLEKNIAIADDLGRADLSNKAKLSLSTLLLETGRYKESIDALNEISKSSLGEELIDDYYIALKEGYGGLSYNTTVQSSKKVYSNFYQAYQDTLYNRLSPNSEESLRLREKQLRDQRLLDEAFVVNQQRLDKVDMGSRNYSLVTFERSLLHELEGNTTAQKKYLILSAISDIRASVKDNASIGSLARIMFAEKDLDRAHRYINFSFDDAEFYNSQLRFVNIANSLPMITKAYEQRSERQKDQLKKSLVYISILVMFLLVAIYMVFRQLKKLRVARNKLKEANDKLNQVNQQLNLSNDDLKRLYTELSEVDKIKERYIGTFLNLYSEYITKLDVYRKLVRKYTNANQTQALLELSKSKQFIDEELQIFNKNFDESFLHIYPDFVDNVNQLLKEEEQISLENKGQLNTELRILALIKLGITNSSRIAKILRYSVNTIYNYRAKIKSAAQDRDSFEENIKNIQ
ncbi:DUF6377 domain-containing protein [Nonlabens xiamenensis]|uniref:DUF6377 domain-containing protein n=1 Tax=Nonlabens xiamenensis TaxID=2341043 RepID=UPI000F60A9EE|nr:DUF6377 domain-containing protein [Nonlabens xiamenensis]